MKFEPQTAIKTDLHTFTLGVSHFLAPFMRYISFNYSSLDRFRQAILGSYMVNVGFIHRNLWLGEFSRMKHPDSKLQNLDETPRHS